LGKVKIINSSILSSGVPIKVSFEDNTLFGFQTKTMLGLRADYELNKHVTFGATYLHLFERPFTQKVNIGDDPINNRIFGLDMNYSNEAPWLTKLVDKLPFLSTKEKSTITFSAETAALKPGHAKAINEESAGDDKGGVNYLDDFDGSGGEFDLKTLYSPNGWVLASIPQNDDEDNNPLFPESDLKDSILTGVNRAHLSWYRMDFGADANENDQVNPYSLRIQRQEIERNYTPTNTYGNTYAQVLDLRYDPKRRGSYNFDVPNGTPVSAGLDPQDGSLLEPQTRWGGIMRSIPTNDFEAANYEFVDFWLMSPYLDTTGADAANPDALDGGMDGYLYFNFGSVSEDILPDSRRMYEHGIPVKDGQENRVVETALGFAPLAQQITDDFDVNGNNRVKQDIGLDGMNDQGERVKFADYLTAVQNVGGGFAAAATNDPSNDNFLHFDDNTLPDDAGIQLRYDRFAKTEGNSPVQSGNSTFTTGGTQRPDVEDLDSDRTLNETESYFQYKIPIESDPSDPRRMRTDNNPFITEFIESEDGGKRIWYRFRIPLQSLQNDSFFSAVGGIRDFRSIRFIRMYMNGFEKPVPLRFGTLELVRNQWRRYSQALGEPCVSPDPSELLSKASLELTNVDIQESSRKLPFGYILPPGINREQAVGGVNTNALQNEGALSLRVCDLEDGDARAIYKNVNLDMRYFSKLKMFVHGEETECGIGYDEIQDGDLSVFIRLGSDFKNNYYEYELPLKISTDSSVSYNDVDYPRVVWPVENDFDIDFEALKDMKLERNNSGTPLGQIYESTFQDPDHPGVKMRIKGNPNLGLVKSVMIGIRNPLIPGSDDCDPSDKKSVEVWVNELRVFGLDERGGVAGIAKLDMQLADLATV
ncbi:MAG: cell surface protein SprA, partial [Bacteroidota bacterium]